MNGINWTGREQEFGVCVGGGVIIRDAIFLDFLGILDFLDFHKFKLSMKNL